MYSGEFWCEFHGQNGLSKVRTNKAISYNIRMSTIKVV